MRFCKNKHQIDDTNAKHCGECGSAISDEIHKCGCGTEILKAHVDGGTAKFCTGCGDALAPAPDLEVVLDELGAFAKARAQVEADLATLPDPDEPASVTERVTEIIKAASVKVKDPNGEDALALQPEPLFEEILKGQGALAADVRTLFAHQQKQNQHLANANAVLMKAATAMGQRIIALEQKLDATGRRPRDAGGKSLNGVTVLGRPGASTPATDDGKLRGEALFAKCAAVTDPELRLSLQETSMLEQHTNLHHGLADIAATRPGLAQRVASLIGEPVPVTTH